MKKLIAVIAVAILTAGSMQAQFKIGARAGLNLTNFKGVSDKSDTKIGFQAGVVGDLSLSDAFVIQPGIVFAQQGGKSTYAPLGEPITSTTTLNYLQVPINIQYKFDLGSVQLFPQAGPYLGFGLWGKVKSKYADIYYDLYDDISESEDIKFGGDNNSFKIFDFGLGFGVGAQFAKSFQFVANYNLGLIRIVAEDSKVTNNGFAFTLTYLFGK